MPFNLTKSMQGYVDKELQEMGYEVVGLECDKSKFPSETAGDSVRCMDFRLTSEPSSVDGFLKLVDSLIAGWTSIFRKLT
jgi:hypothetical protein